MEREAVLSLGDASEAFDALCAHFREDHDFDVTVVDTQADIAFPGGVCAMTASPASLSLRVAVDDPGALPMVESFFTSHLQRMALKAGQSVEWVQPAVGALQRGDRVGARLRSLAAVLDEAARPAERG